MLRIAVFFVTETVDKLNLTLLDKIELVLEELF